MFCRKKDVLHFWILCRVLSIAFYSGTQGKVFASACEDRKLMLSLWYAHRLLRFYSHLFSNHLQFKLILSRLLLFEPVFETGKRLGPLPSYFFSPAYWILLASAGAKDGTYYSTFVYQLGLHLQFLLIQLYWLLTKVLIL